jgi:hypothetical protein
VFVAKKVTMTDEMSKKAIFVEISKGALFFQCLLDSRCIIAWQYAQYIQPISPNVYCALYEGDDSVNRLFSAMYGQDLRKAVWIRIKRWDGHWAKEETHMLEISQVD